MSTRHWRSFTFTLMAAALAVTACATARATAPASPIPNVAAIAGTWTGVLEAGGGQQTCTLTIEPSGAATIVGQRTTANGSITVQDGKGSYDFPGRSQGTLTLYTESGKRQLYLTGTGGPFHARVTPKQ